MRRAFLISFLVSLLLIGGGIWYVFQTYLPAHIEKSAGTVLRGSGLDPAVLPKPVVTADRIVYSDIALDPDGFSTIENITVLFDPLYFMMHGQADTLRLSGVNLTGEMKDGRALHIVGVDAGRLDLHGLFSRFSNVEVAESRISVLTEDLGGVSLQYDMQAARSENNEVRLQGHVNSKQRYVSFIAGVSGALLPDQSWRLIADIEQGKIEFPLVKASRIGAYLQFAGGPDMPASVTGEYRSGGLALYKTPWQNAVGSVEGTLSDLKILTDAKSVGHEGIELSLTGVRSKDRLFVTGKVHTESLKALLEYVGQHNGALPADDRLLALTQEQDLSNTEVTFKVEGLNSLLNERLIYRTANPDGPGVVQGRIPLTRP